MNDFNFESITRKMPYKEPSEEYFNNLEHNILHEVKELQLPKRRSTKMHYIFMATAVAASLLIGVFVLFDNRLNTPDCAIEKLASHDLDQSIDLYLEHLSDSDIQALAAETADQDVFYSILP